MTITDDRSVVTCREAHARRPPTLTLLPGGSPGARRQRCLGQRRIVVALDRSAAGGAALRWAVEEARRREAIVEVVSNRLDLAHVPAWRSGVDHRAEAVAERARTVQREIVRAALGDLRTVVGLRLRITEAPLAVAVGHTGRGADLVVLAPGRGWRGRIRRRSLLRRTRRLDCPVVVMPGTSASASGAVAPLRLLPQPA